MRERWRIVRCTPHKSRTLPTNVTSSTTIIISTYSRDEKMGSLTSRSSMQGKRIGSGHIDFQMMMRDQFPSMWS